MFAILTRMDMSEHPTQPGGWLRIADLMSRYAVSRQTVYEWRRRGVLPPATQLGPNVVGWPADLIQRWEAERPGAVSARIEERRGRPAHHHPAEESTDETIGARGR